MIDFGEWLPDQPPYQNPGVTVARNVTPLQRGYGPFPSLSVYSDALDARCQGAVSAKAANGTAYVFAGDASKLYSIADASWADVSKGGGYTTDEDRLWEFVKWGSTVIATNYNDAVQVLTLGGSNFADLITSTRKPKGRHIGIVQDFVVLGNVTDTTDGAKPKRVWWSALGDSTDFDPDVTTQSGFQDLEGVGNEVRKVIGGDYGTIFTDRSIIRMSYDNKPLLFRFDEIEENRGALASGSVIKFGPVIFYAAEDGFFMQTGSGSQPISADKVTSYFFDDVDANEYGKMSAAIDAANQLVLFGYQSKTAESSIPDKVLIYRWSNGRWAEAELVHQFFVRALSEGTTLEALDNITTDLDALEISLDSSVWAGGDAVLAAFDADNKLAYLTGSALTARIETGEYQLVPTGRAFVRNVKPMVDGGTTTVYPITRNRPADTTSEGSGSTVNEIGKCPMRSNARYHRFRVDISGGFEHALGVKPEFGSVGVR